jgi:hypothetical protein
VAGGVTVDVRRAGGEREIYTRAPCAHRRTFAATVPATMQGFPCLVAVEACEACGAHLRPLDPALLAPEARA